MEKCYNYCVKPEITRERIVEYLRNFASSKDYVFAMWLEGADGLDKVDGYSDIDFWFDVKKEYQESFLHECIRELQKLGEIDSRVDEIRKEIAQSNIHLANTSEYLTLDISVQSHETRGLDATCFVKNDLAERPLVLFDKGSIITFKDAGGPNIEELRGVFRNNKSRIIQSSRVTKYIKRNQYSEAYLKYVVNIADPLVAIARAIYTPSHLGYGLCHIGDHLPKEIVQKLEQFYKVASFEDIENNISKAKELLEAFEQQFAEKYGIITDKF